MNRHYFSSQSTANLKKEMQQMATFKCQDARSPSLIQLIRSRYYRQNPRLPWAKALELVDIPAPSWNPSRNCCHLALDVTVGWYGATGGATILGPLHGCQIWSIPKPSSLISAFSQVTIQWSP